MVQRDNEMINSFWRIKWWRYRYALAAGILLNIFLINRFFLDQSISDLNPFPVTPSPPPTVPQPKEDSAPPPPPPPPSGVVVPPPKSSATYNLNDYDFNGEYVGWPLERLCGETKWQDGLVFVCDNNSGGIGNIRNFVLTCIRYAIEAGATGITMPQIQRRSETDLANIFSTSFQPFNYFFDEEHFRKSLETHCPQMKIFSTKMDVPHPEKTQEITEFYPKDLNVDLDGCDGRGVNRHLDQFRQKFDQWIIDNKRPSSWEEPTTLRFKWATFFEWPVVRDGPEFAATFGDLLRINKNIENIAVKTIMELQKFAGAEPDGTHIAAPYLGVHLRTESDALNFWPDFNTQSDGYIREAESRNIRHAYLASGNATDGRRFGKKAYEKMGLNVTQKMDLLTGDDLKALTDLSWDQQALVDFLVLSKSTHFTGCSFSSFAMNIGMKRHLMTGGINSRPWRSPGDAFTTLVGRFDSWYDDWMFMYECMWP
jgi:hypothetical protein